MSRILMLIAMLFAFASVGGASASYAHGGHGSRAVFGTAFDVTDQCASTAAVSKTAAYKPCTKKLNGIAVPCAHQPLMLPAAVAGPIVERRAERIVSATDSLCAGPGDEPQLRPPRA